MPKFLVTLPITGVVCVEVVADDEQSAIAAAFNSDFDRDSIEEWEVHEHITRGNVFSGMQNSAEAQEIK